MNAEERSAHSRGWETAETVFGAGFLVGVLLGLVYPLRLSTWIPRPVSILVGIALIGAGLAVVTVARRQFREAAQPTDPGHPTTRLMTDGIFAWSRNPLYLGGVLTFLGLGALLNSLWLLIFIIPTIVAVHFILVAPEERYLAAKFGQSYHDYARSIHRWFGRRSGRR